MTAGRSRGCTETGKGEVRRTFTHRDRTDPQPQRCVGTHSWPGSHVGVSCAARLSSALPVSKALRAALMSLIPLDARRLTMNAQARVRTGNKDTDCGGEARNKQNKHTETQTQTHRHREIHAQTRRHTHTHRHTDTHTGEHVRPQQRHHHRRGCGEIHRSWRGAKIVSFERES